MDGRKIKFNNEYTKLKGIDSGDEVMLLEVFKSELKNLSKTFLSYDTLCNDGTYYVLGADNLVLLFHEPSTGRMFTTIRRRTDAKEVYYMNKRGEYFEVVIDG